MKKALASLLTTFVLSTAPVAEARDDVKTFPLEPVLNSVKAEEALFDIPFYFAGQQHASIANSSGEVTTSRKTNAFGKSDREACEWVLLSAIKSLQAEAEARGYDAVVNIKSNYDHNEFVSATEFQCGAGFLMAGVALKGELANFD
ncbi:MAG: excinuclease ABC subunit A [Idiomarinaceae bacterium]|jgi:hypothetical protein|nr:excinuclease ABC subunit A [Idiomarinaceae bacterium]HAD49164.1 excinuclease ABC subunit A [Idiomarina sp.]